MNEFGILKDPKNTKIVVAMSGGVDSSCVAALLKSKGYDVVGITLQLYDQAQDLKRKGACCAGQDIYDAKMVSERLGIPHYVLDYESLFKQSVIDEFVESYINGETPIPCVKCNQTVKFRDLLKFAKDLGADALATGHYVRRINGADGAQLHRAIDPTKDQSYFLFATTKEQLEFTHFPLGSNTKEETRMMAQKFGLKVADKPDSQDICFVPNGSYADIIAKLRPEGLVPGDIVHLDGKVLGRHNGIVNYTIGQRKGLGISSLEPLYVIKLDAEKAQVIVGPNEALDKMKFKVKNANWLISDLVHEIRCSVKVRSGHKPVSALVIPDLANNGFDVILDDFERAVTPGQACVIYDDTRVLGGGWISREKIV